MADTFTGSAARARANSMLVRTMAAAPSEVAQISSSVSGSATTGEASTSASLNSLGYRALGLVAPWRLFLARTRAKSSLVAP